MPTLIKILLIVVGLGCLGWLTTMIVFSASSRRPDNLGVHAGRLAPCPSSPNCICSMDEGSHAIEPLVFSGSAEEAWQRLKAIVIDQSRAQIIHEEADYFHAEFTSALFRFVD